MTNLGELEKLRILIPHWIEHNQEHANEFRSWSTSAHPAAEDIELAAARMEAANEALRAALSRLDGPLEHDIDPHT
ncbi:MAG: hypothetical protein PVF85_09600 [Anaerolineales bacterium]|jgi:hypothetical protein